MSAPTPATNTGTSLTSGSLQAAAKRIDSELTRKPNRPVQFSATAVDALQEAHSDYLGELGREAVRLTRSDGLSTVDATHIQRAAAVVGCGTQRGSSWASTLNALGGLVGGAGAASSYAVLFTPGPHTTAELVTALVLSVVGAVLLAVGIAITFASKS